MVDETSLKQIFQKLVPDGSGVLEGFVVNESPLSIQLTNDSKMLLGSNLLLVPKHLSIYKASVDIKVGAVITTGTMTVYNNLKKTDKIYLLSFNNGKKYYILDRVVS